MVVLLPRPKPVGHQLRTYLRTYKYVAGLESAPLGCCKKDFCHIQFSDSRQCKAYRHKLSLIILLSLTEHKTQHIGNNNMRYTLKSKQTPLC